MASARRKSKLTFNSFFLSLRGRARYATNERDKRTIQITSEGTRGVEVKSWHSSQQIHSSPSPSTAKSPGGPNRSDRHAHTCEIKCVGRAWKKETKKEKKKPFFFFLSSFRNSLPSHTFASSNLHCTPHIERRRRGRGNG